MVTTALILLLALLASAPGPLLAAAVSGEAASWAPASSHTSRQSAPARASLPYVAVPPAARADGTLVLLITGDGGWASADRAVANRLAADGAAVLALNSLHYFARPRTPTGLAADLTALARLGCARWSCERIVLVGYSMGADVLPFVVDRLAADVRARLAGLVLISLSHEATFRFLPTQWLGLRLWPGVATVPQLARVSGVPLVCIYGARDRDAACRDLSPRQAELVALPGGHVMAGVAGRLAAVVAGHVRQLQATSARSGPRRTLAPLPSRP